MADQEYLFWDANEAVRSDRLITAVRSGARSVLTRISKMIN